jgi:hypothetical protein
VWVDANGYTTITRINTGPGAAAVQPLMIACSTADYSEYWEGTTTPNGAPAPAGGAYQPGKLRALLYFGTAAATVATLAIPAPSLSIFLADGETVDAANVAVAALIAQCLIDLTDNVGNAVTSYLAGHLVPAP